MRRGPLRPDQLLYSTLCVASFAGFAWLALQLRFCWQAEREWGSAPATILEARCREWQLPRPFGRVESRVVPEVFYAYSVEGVEYEGRAIAPLWSAAVGSNETQRAALRGLEPLATTAIRFDRERPERSYLTLDFDVARVFGWLALAAGVALASGSAWLSSMRVELGGRASPPRLGLALAGAGALTLALGGALAGELLLEAWIAALVLLAVALRSRGTRRPSVAMA